MVSDLQDHPEVTWFLPAVVRRTLPGSRLLAPKTLSRIGRVYSQNEGGLDFLAWMDAQEPKSLLFSPILAQLLTSAGANLDTATFGIE